RKSIPTLKSAEEAKSLLDRDLTDYRDLDNFTVVRFEFLPKTKKVNLRVPEALLEAVRQQAKQEGSSYQQYIRRAVEKSLVADRLPPRIIPGAVARPILSGLPYGDSWKRRGQELSRFARYRYEGEGLRPLRQPGPATPERPKPSSQSRSRV